MKSEYVHQKLGENVYALAGEYAPLREVRLKYNDREVLYIVSGGIADSGSCAGGGCLNSIIVPGYLVGWKTKTSKEGLPVSEVTPVSDNSIRLQITKIIQANEGITNINFW